MVENVAPKAAWDALQKDPEAVLVDVRSEAEWAYVGLPDLSAVGKQPVLIPWQIYPAMAINPHFLAQMQDAGITPQQRVYFLCRTGGRSLAAARAATEAGFPQCYNVEDGFEGPADAAGHRGHVAGWKATDLPWRQR